MNKQSKTISVLTKINKHTPRGIKNAIFAIVFGLVVGTIFISFAGFNPIQVFYVMFSAWSRTMFTLGDLLSLWSFYIVAGLASLVAFKAGLFNIGIGGQMMLGGMCAYLVGVSIHIEKEASIIVSLLVAGAVGTVVSIVIILLKIFFNIHEVLSSIMLNWIIYYGYKWIFNSSAKWYVNDNLEGIQIPYNSSLRYDWLTNLFPHSQISIGIFIAVICIIFIFILLKFTTFGFAIKMAGLNKHAARYSGLKVKGTMIRVMALSGFLAGISGVIFFMGYNQTIPLYKDGLPSEYFNAIAVTLLGQNNPIGIIFSGIFFGVITNAQDAMGILGISFEVSHLILSIVMYAVAFSSILSIYHPIGYLYKRYQLGKSKQRALDRYRSARIGGRK